MGSVPEEVAALDAAVAEATVAAGAAVKGEFRCTECGYGVTVARALPVCPMCHGSDWERVESRPFARLDVYAGIENF